MASASPSTDAEEAATCPICLDWLNEPVSVDCGHNYCHDCITQHCEAWKEMGPLECPVCKAKFQRENFRPNWQLASIVERLQLRSLRLGRNNLCARHNETLHLFCKEDEELVCVFCERSPEHRTHTIVLLKDAAKEYKDRFCSYLEILRKESENLLASTANTEEESRDLLKKTETQAEKRLAVFRQLHQFLEEQETLSLAQMEELEKEIVTRRDEHIARLQKELSSLQVLIQKLEEKCQQPASELLQDVGGTLERYEKRETFGYPVAFSAFLAYRSWALCNINPFLDSLKDNVISELQQQKEAVWSLPGAEQGSDSSCVAAWLRESSGYNQVNVTLDPDTAHPLLVLSEDCRSVRRGVVRQDLPKNPERFDMYAFVLGCEGFAAGSHFWEVSVGGGEKWAVGVAKTTIKRKGAFDIGPNEGIWAMANWRGGYRDFRSSGHLILSLRGEPKRIQVSLDCAKGWVGFVNADTGVQLLAYSEAALSTETLLPFFYVGKGGHMTLLS